MKRAASVLVLAMMLPACGLFEKLTGGGDKQQAIQEKPEPKPVEPVTPDKLVALLPKLEGWEARAPAGNYVDLGQNKASRATGLYEKKIEELALTATLTIVDGAYSANIYGPLARMAHAKPGDPHKMAITIGEHSGIQEWQPEAGKVSVALVVARRFLITLEGQNLSPQFVQAFLGGIDIKQLESWAGDKPPGSKSAAAPGR